MKHQHKINLEMLFKIKINNKEYDKIHLNINNNNNSDYQKIINFIY